MAAQPSLMPAQPQPRPARSPEQVARIRVQNRRLEYLRRNPAYLESSEREFADVSLYHRLIRSFQTPAERVSEAQEKGFGRVLEASILRNPEPLNVLSDEDVVEEEGEEDLTNKGTDAGTETGTGLGSVAQTKPEEQWLGDGSRCGMASGQCDLDTSNLASREAGRRRWQAFLRDWFVSGGAQEDGFNYSAVDDDSDYDVLAKADAEEAWFDDEPEGWASDTDEGGDRQKRAGETGIQDF